MLVTLRRLNFHHRYFTQNCFYLIPCSRRLTISVSTRMFPSTCMSIRQILFNHWLLFLLHLHHFNVFCIVFHEDSISTHRITNGQSPSATTTHKVLPSSNIFPQSKKIHEIIFSRPVNYLRSVSVPAKPVSGSHRSLLLPHFVIEGHLHEFGLPHHASPLPQ